MNELWCTKNGQFDCLMEISYTSQEILNFQNWSKMVQNWSKSVKISQNWSKFKFLVPLLPDHFKNDRLNSHSNNAKKKSLPDSCEPFF